VTKRIFARLMGRDPRECEHVRAEFSDYVDGDLKPEAAAQLEAHIGICPRCRQALTNLRITLGGLGRLNQDEPEADLSAADRARQAWRDRLE